MSASEPSLLTKVPGMARAREIFDGMSPRERSLLAVLVAVVITVLVLGGAGLVYDRIATLEEQTEAIWDRLLVASRIDNRHRSVAFFEYGCCSCQHDRFLRDE